MSKSSGEQIHTMQIVGELQERIRIVGDDPLLALAAGRLQDMDCEVTQLRLEVARMKKKDAK